MSCREDTFSLGVCNGCQLMALLGWVPGTGNLRLGLGFRTINVRDGFGNQVNMIKICQCACTPMHTHVCGPTLPEYFQIKYKSSSTQINCTYLARKKSPKVLCLPCSDINFALYTVTVHLFPALLICNGGEAWKKCTKYLLPCSDVRSGPPAGRAAAALHPQQERAL